MVYLVIALAIITGLYGLYRFFLNATVPQIKSFFLVSAVIVVNAALFYMAITGRLAAALGLIAVAVPMVIAWLRDRRLEGDYKNAAREAAALDGKMTRETALAILGLKDSASDEDAEKAYKRLMKKVHPDQEGSEWLASQINAAHDFLTGKK